MNGVIKASWHATARAHEANHQVSIESLFQSDVPEDAMETATNTRALGQRYKVPVNRW
jgi:hypothetical protein